MEALIQWSALEIFTNYQSLKYLFSQKDLNLTKIKWLELLQDYDIHFQYHPRMTNVATDALSETMPYSQPSSLYINRIMWEF